MSFLPITKEEMNERGWEQADFVMVMGDAYVDHPSFGTAIISRQLERFGYRVAVLPQPKWNSANDFRRFGRPRLGFLIGSGNVDSMVNNYSVFKNRRRRDVYSPGGEGGRRPDRALTVYANRAREAYRDVPVIVGGLEASLRRLAHYDYWSNSVRRSVLLDSKADILIYGMGERAIVEIAEALNSGIDACDIGWVRGTCVRRRYMAEDLTREFGEEIIMLPSFEEVRSDKKAYCESFANQYRNCDSITARPLVERYGGQAVKGADSGDGQGSKGVDSGGGQAVIQLPPQPPLEREELDDIYGMDFERGYHPAYEAAGGVPALTEVKFSITGSRGCFGGCSFCALTYHQGRQVRSRSKDSIVGEAIKLTELPDFKGYIHDVGGPTANFHNPACEKQLTEGVCEDRQCMWPKPCKNMNIDHEEYLDVLRAVRNLPKIKKVFIRSGIRYDYLMADRGTSFMEELCKHHISGMLKVAPEHISRSVLRCMHKPSHHVFDEFCKEYEAVNRRLGKKQYMIPYLISSHPGSKMDDAIELALYLKEKRLAPDQVQDFYPTPGTLSTCMYYTETDPFTKRPVYVAKDIKEKQMQRALLHFRKPENQKKVIEACDFADRSGAADELIGARAHKYQKKGQKNESVKRTGRNNRKK